VITVVTAPVVVWTRRNVSFRTTTGNVIQPNLSATRTDMSKRASGIPVCNHQPQMILIYDTVYNTTALASSVPVSHGLRTKFGERTFFSRRFLAWKKLPIHIVRFCRLYPVHLCWFFNRPITKSTTTMTSIKRQVNSCDMNISVWKDMKHTQNYI